MHPLRVGLNLVPQHTDVEALRTVWRIADEAGFDHVWNFDHFAPIFSDPKGPVLEAWTLLGAMAQATRRARIGVMVTGNVYRHPGVLAKMAVTVDHLSGGRLEMGIGAGWAENELAMLGMPVPGVGERVSRLREAVRLMKLLWTQEVSSFEGRYYRLADAVSAPKPLQKPHPPVWIGGRGERRTLRIVAEEADVWNVVGAPPEEGARLSRVLDAHCEAVGRDPATLRRSASIRFGGDVPQALDALARYFELGFTELVIGLAPANPGRDAEKAAAELLPELRRLGAARDAGAAARQ
jgi:F420-dependent oxidoreductase-like protein